jgi:hypothetical protein
MDVILEKMEKRRSDVYLLMVILIIGTFITIMTINLDSSTAVNKNKINIFIIGAVSIFCILMNLGNKKIEKKFLEDYNNLSLKDKEIIEKGMREPEVELKNITMTDVALLAIDRNYCMLIFYRDITKVVRRRVDRISRDCVEIYAGGKSCGLLFKYSGGADKVVSTILKHNHRVNR